ncbi:hypothetical protein KBB17_00360 [Candidatus Saccharibacteria bacterium]|jgi:flagellar basal body-associated protein FliL|nr:hypothetical protein [Candidatus Saccharibacteria bacterium]MBP9131504.1 hypothetical protein [Candidatus Saccharibacteria bacterium]
MVNFRKHKKIIILTLLVITISASGVYYFVFFRKTAFDGLSDQEIEERAGHTFATSKTSNKDREESIERTLKDKDAGFIEYLTAAQSALELKDKAKTLEVVDKARQNLKELDEVSEGALQKLEAQAKELK